MATRSRLRLSELDKSLGLAFSPSNVLTFLPVLLVSAYIGCQMIADIAAVKLVQLFGVVIPAGTFVYAATFTIRDLIHRRLGKRAAESAIASAAIVNVAMALYFNFTIGLPYPVFWGGQEAYSLTLMSVWSIVLSSIVAEMLSELVDTEVYHMVRDWNPGLRVVLSNIVSVPLDSVLFAGLAFVLIPYFQTGQPFLDWASFGSMVLGQTLFKWVVATVVLPTVYLFKDR